MTEAIKDSGRASLPYAVDETNNMISAENAISGGKYFCPVCRCSMHVTTTRSGVRVFARNPRIQHTNAQCINYEAKNTKHSFDKLEPENFIGSLCRVSQRIPSSGGAQGGGGSQPGTDETDDVKYASFTSLKQISEEIDFLDGGLTQGNHKISDFVLTYKSARQVFRASRYQLGARIVFCRYKAFDAKRQAILFDLFSKSNRPEIPDLSVRICLVFPNKTDFAHWRDQFGSFAEDENGRRIFKRKYDAQDVLIAFDDWQFIERPACVDCCGKHICDKCYGMYQAVYTNPKQIYLVPTDH